MGWSESVLGLCIRKHEDSDHGWSRCTCACAYIHIKTNIQWRTSSTPNTVVSNRANETTLIAAYNGTSPLRFEPIKLDFPANMAPEKIRRVPDKLLLAGHSWGKGYRHMSRFFCHDVYFHEVGCGPC